MGDTQSSTYERFVAGEDCRNDTECGEFPYCNLGIEIFYHYCTV